jgi:hypothetical protein
LVSSPRPDDVGDEPPERGCDHDDHHRHDDNRDERDQVLEQIHDCLDLQGRCCEQDHDESEEAIHDARSEIGGRMPAFLRTGPIPALSSTRSTAAFS